MIGVRYPYSPRLRVGWVITLFAVTALFLLRPSSPLHGPADVHVSVITGNTTANYTYDGWERQYLGIPQWVQRYPFLPTAKDVPEDKRVCFVHIGKTAGRTLRHFLGFAGTFHGSRQNHTITLPPGNLPLYTTNMIHVEMNTCFREKIGVYLFTVRDPLHRLMSWFTYERPTDQESQKNLKIKKPLYIDCGFQSINELGEKMSEGDATECSRVAWKAVTGSQGYKKHNRMGYGYHWRKIPSNKDVRIAVIRTEHIVEDWFSVERVSLQSDIPANTTFSFGKPKNQSSKTKQDKYLSKMAQQNLCKGLCEEIQIYKMILRKAENLSPEDVATSIEELAQNCPVQAAAEDCPA